MKLYQVTTTYLDSVVQMLEEAIHADDAGDLSVDMTLLLEETKAILQGPDNASNEASDEGTVSEEDSDPVQADAEPAVEEAPVL